MKTVMVAMRIIATTAAVTHPMSSHGIRSTLGGALALTVTLVLLG